MAETEQINAFDEEEKLTALIPAEDHDFLDRVLEYWKTVEDIEIKTQEQYDNAAKICIELADNRRTLDKRRAELKSPWDQKANYVQSQFKAVIDPITNGEKKLKNAMAIYHAEEQRKIEEANRKKEAEAAEARRKAEEKAAAETAKAEEYRKQGREELAEKAEARAEAAEEKATTTVAVTEELRTTGKGISYITDYKANLVDKIAFLRYALDKMNLYLQQVSVNVKPYEAMQKQFNGSLKIPGIEFIKTNRVAARSNRKVL